MLRTSQRKEITPFDPALYNLQAPDRRAFYRRMEAATILRQRRMRRINKYLDRGLILLCVGVSLYVAGNVLAVGYERLHHQSLLTLLGM
ncbi:hypothetical protein [Ralstonia phage RP31]|uniref:Transmembrane protein n=2 Tax=Ripduovirus RP12 TaxID=2560700 RepID=A0A1L7N139_9CAUD|nr:hypothetical protein FDH28_gp202 [Ralstonia phage RP12]BAW19193.1 hypothetical protein [Ralstonia phage RP12]BAW19479.1 hypothetical protein [Ralstonia phage RP31]